MKLSDNEKRDVIKYLEANKPLPEKYRFLLFDDDREVELLWNGKTNEVTNVVLPFQTIEQIDEPRSDAKFGMQESLFDTSGRQITGWTNKLIWGDNKLILSSLKNGPLRKEIEAQGGLKLIYIDPPFDVGADFSMDLEIGDESFTKKPSVIEEIAYRDTWGMGVDSFIAMIYERLLLMYDLLAEDGSIYVHCDWRVSAFIRMALDEIFGKENILNEIIWSYKRYTARASSYQKMHDTIYYFGKTIDKHIFNQVFDEYQETTLKYHKWELDENGKEFYWKRGSNIESYKIYKNESGVSANDVWNMPQIGPIGVERKEVGYPTQKPELLINRIIRASSHEGDLVADFFCGSGTTLAVAEKLGRKWIGSDLGKFAIHTSRKRLIGVQRELKKAGTDFRAFEILNVGKYERENFLATNDDLRAEEKNKQAQLKEKEFVKLIISAYKAELIEGFISLSGKKRDRLVAVGPISTPVSAKLIQDVVDECKTNNFTKVDVLGFDYEMGMDFQDYKNQGIDIAFRIIPREVFDKKAVEKDQVKFYDVAYLDVKSMVKGRGNTKEISVELSGFSVYYNQDASQESLEALKPGGSKVIVENGQVVKISKDKTTEEVTREVLTKKWTDWIDYWAVDYNFADRKEIIAEYDKDGHLVETWTGDYVFDNEWQSFRTKKNRNLELTSAPKEVGKGKYKIAVKVVDIFGNDTTKVVEISV